MATFVHISGCQWQSLDLLQLPSWAGVLKCKFECADAPPGGVDPEDGVLGLDDDLEAEYMTARLTTAIHPSSFLPQPAGAATCPVLFCESRRKQGWIAFSIGHSFLMLC